MFVGLFHGPGKKVCAFGISRTINVHVNLDASLKNVVGGNMQKAEYSTEELQEYFTVEGFGGGCYTVVTRKGDGVRGSLKFDPAEHPRVYRDFEEA